MDWKRTTSIGVSSGAVVALLAAASTPTVRERAPSPPPASTSDRRDETTLVVESARLGDRARKQGESSVTVRRNLFAFAAVERASSAPTRGSEAPAHSSEARLPDEHPQWRLIGVATSRDPQSTARTAILAGEGLLQFVSAGDALPDGLRVVVVGEESVELSSGADRVIVLRLSK